MSGIYDLLSSLSETPKTTTNNTSICEICNSDNIIANSQSHICNQCGNVTEMQECSDIYEVTAQSSSTSVISSLLPHISLSTRIKGLTNTHIKNIHRWNTVPYKERKLSLMFALIKCKCNILKLSKYIADSARLLYYNVIMGNQPIVIKSFSTNKRISSSRGNNRIGTIAACIYYACCDAGKIKTVREISIAFGISTACLNKGCKAFIKCLKKSAVNFKITICNPLHFINQICESLNIGQYKDAITNIIDRVIKYDLITTHSPNSITIACALMYLNNSGISFDKKTLPQKMHISMATINKVYEDLCEYSQFLLGISNIPPVIEHGELSSIELQMLMDNVNSIEKMNYNIEINFREIKRIFSKNFIFILDYLQSFYRIKSICE